MAFARPSDKLDRLAGLPPGEVRRIHESAGSDVTLVKADGARSRWIKAPDPDEPQLPEGVDTVIPVVSARAIGERLREDIAHRLDRITALVARQAARWALALTRRFDRVILAFMNAESPLVEIVAH